MHTSTLDCSNSFPYHFKFSSFILRAFNRIVRQILFMYMYQWPFAHLTCQHHYIFLLSMSTYAHLCLHLVCIALLTTIISLMISIAHVQNI